MRSRFQKIMKNQKGMTLVELLAVIVILGIVAAIAVPSIGKVIDNSKKDAQKSNALLIINAAKLAVASNDETITSKIDQTTDPGKVTLQELKSAGYLDTIPKDPYAKDKAYDGNANFVTITKNGSNFEYLITLLSSNDDASYTNISEDELNGAAKDSSGSK